MAARRRWRRRPSAAPQHTGRPEGVVDHGEATRGWMALGGPHKGWPQRGRLDPGGSLGRPSAGPAEYMHAKWLSPYDRNPSTAVDQPLSSPRQKQTAARASLPTTTTISQASSK
ncbi:hypothetical protein KSP40_PGU014883 [Platanthera guangdongensis]|uniref:Uncharacterized protein n=1 Tax=Platanthera guangdongensis TaxID=2320717 RepID=A0ABR2N3E6_9ASPA